MKVDILKILITDALCFQSVTKYTDITLDFLQDRYVVRHHWITDSCKEKFTRRSFGYKVSHARRRQGVRNKKYCRWQNLQSQLCREWRDQPINSVDRPYLLNWIFTICKANRGKEYSCYCRWEWHHLPYSRVEENSFENAKLLNNMSEIYFVRFLQFLAKMV